MAGSSGENKYANIKLIKTILQYIRIFITVFIPNIAKILQINVMIDLKVLKSNFEIRKEHLYLSKVLLYLSSLYVLREVHVRIILRKYIRA